MNTKYARLENGNLFDAATEFREDNADFIAALSAAQSRFGFTRDESAALLASLVGQPDRLRRQAHLYERNPNLTGPWTEDPVLLMPDATDWHEGMITGHDDVVTGAGEGLRALFYEDWGGTKVRPE